jgi:bacteriocin-like protein
MTRSKKPNETPDALLDAASKDAKITKQELSEEELKSVSGGGGKVSVEYKPQKADGSLDAGIRFKYDLKGQKEG